MSKPVASANQTAPTPTAIADVLERAADWLEPEGRWMQGDYCSGESTHPAACCVLGALNLQASGDACAMWLAMEYRNALHKRLEVEGLIDPGCSPAQFNDAPERTQPEVVAKLREVAAAQRAQVAA